MAPDSGSDEDAIFVWDVGTGERLAEVQCAGVWCRALAVCGDFLASGHGMLDDSFGGVKFWRMSKALSEWRRPDHAAQDSCGEYVLYILVYHSIYYIQPSYTVLSYALVYGGIGWHSFVYQGLY